VQGGIRNREALAVGAGLLVMLAFLHHYFELTVNHTDKLMSIYAAIIERRADAPDQYRVLPPFIAETVANATGIGLRSSVRLLDTAYLLGGFAVVTAMMRARGVMLYVVPAATYIAFLGIGTLRYPRPEALPAFLAVSAVALAFTTDGRWGWLVVFTAAAVMAFSRVDVLAAASIPFALRFRTARRRSDAITAVSLVLGAAGATFLAAHAFPSEYRNDVSILQLGHNLDPANAIVPVLFLAPALLPLTDARARERVGTLLPFVGMLVGHLAIALVLGRLDEIRIFFPHAGVAAAIGVLGWLGIATDASVSAPGSRT